MVTAEVAINVRVYVTVSFQEERIESYDNVKLEVAHMKLAGANDLKYEDRRILYKRAKDIVESQFDLDEIE